MDTLMGNVQWVLLAIFGAFALVYVGASVYLMLRKCPKCGGELVYENLGMLVLVLKGFPVIARHKQVCKNCRWSAADAEDK